MVTKEEVLEEYGLDQLDESRNVSLSEEELENDSKGQLIKKAGQLRDRRNELNQMASERASKRDDLNAKTREKVDEAQEHRESRDELNEQVQEHKESRNTLNAEANELFDEVEEMKQDLELGSGKSIEELKEEIEDLEFKQQTEVLGTDEERELIEKIENKREKLAEKKGKVDQSGELEELIEEAEALPEVSVLHAGTRLREDGVLVNTVSPAFIETPLVTEMMEAAAAEQGITTDEAVQRFLDEHRPHIEVGRPGTIEEVGRVVAFLASEHASFVNGSDYRVDGGSVASM